MRHLSLACLCLLALHPLALAAPAKFDAVAFLEGSFEGEGKLVGATYRETFTGKRILAGSAVEIRSRSMMGERVVFEDLRVISWDPATSALRMRQWSSGWLRVYAQKPAAEGRVVFEETHHEGPAQPPWRYTFVPQADGGFDYTVEARSPTDWGPFAAGRLRPLLEDPGKGGAYGLRQYETRIVGMAAEVHSPDGKGPFPAIVFSPGGAANSFQGYRPYGRWFASWGYITAIVAFNDEDAQARAAKFGKVLDWFEGENTRDGAALKGQIDCDHFVSAGHSRGAFAALLAARADQRFDACLALAPSGPSSAAPGEGEASTCIIVGSKDRFLAAAGTAYGLQAGERFLLTISGMTHMLQPREAALKLIARSTAFLEYAVRGDERYREPLVREEVGLSVSAASK